jgi:hypothetical protein
MPQNEDNDIVMHMTLNTINDAIPLSNAKKLAKRRKTK